MRCIDPAEGAVKLQWSSRESNGRSRRAPAEPPPSWQAEDGTVTVRIAEFAFDCASLQQALEA
jgi:hypothetical protein